MSEQGQDLAPKPRARSAPTPAGGSTATRSSARCRPRRPAADLRALPRRGRRRALHGYVEIPATMPGVTVNDDWDALGMRPRAATRSPSTASSCRPPARRLPAGELAPPRAQPPLRPVPRLGVAGHRRGGVLPHGAVRADRRRRPRADARRRVGDRPRGRAGRDRAGRHADRRPPRGEPDGSRRGRRDRRPVRRGPGGEDVRQRRRDAGRRPGRWRCPAGRPQRLAPRARLPRRARRSVHASARRQPGLRVPRRRRPRPPHELR